MDKRTEQNERLLEIIRSFLSEFKSEGILPTINLKAHIDRDLGIDSLGRVELLLRVEKAFGVSLPTTLMAEAETVEDIAKALSSSNLVTNRTEKKQHFAPILEESKLDPSSANNLVEVLLRYAAEDADRPHLYLTKDNSENTGEEEQIIRYGQLLKSAQKVAAGLLELNLKPKETVAIMLPTSEEFFYAFFGVLIAGGIPVPIYPPYRADKIEEYAVREARILNNAQIKILITFSQAEALSKLLRIFITSLTAVTTVQNLVKSNHKVPTISLTGDDYAMIQYTSGSTSDPKGVLLTHNNLLANIRSIGKAIAVSPRDVGVSWLPLYHDMGLIGAWFSSLYQGFPLAIMSPLTFLSRPEKWLWSIHYHRGSLSGGPNFAYELCNRRINETDIEGLDLSSWRLAFNGAEAINSKTLKRFAEKFAPYGLKPETIYPVYGLAECSVALTFPPLGRKPKTDIILREPFEVLQKAISASKEDEDTLEFVACGKPIPFHEIRIVDKNNQELGERQIGTLQFAGPSTMIGYYNNPEATQAIYHEGWLDSGDYAYIADNDVYITGRKKDLIIKAGRNLYPQEIEEVASQISGIRKGCVAAFGIVDPRLGTEKLIIVAETNETNTKVKNQLTTQIFEKVAAVLGIPPDDVCLVPPRTIPKTSSGKLQRNACKQMYSSRKLLRKGLPVWLQLTKLFLLGAVLSVRNFAVKSGQLFYTGYVLLLSLFLLTPLFLLSALGLNKNGLLTTIRLSIRILLILSFNRFTVTGKEHLYNEGTKIFVANHASYMDSLILLCILPNNTLFVVKKELLTWPLVGKIVKKLGYLPVDRIDYTKSIANAEAIIESIKYENSIMIFPEGTFTYATGLRAFKLGAFKIAVDTGMPVCPIGIRGTRRFMRGDSFLFKPTHFEVIITESIRPNSKEWSEVTRLHSEARNAIIKSCGEQSIHMVRAGLEH